jgi:hypothetical protein
MTMTMNTRERFLASMRFELCDHPPYWEWAYWIETLRRWYAEGLPCHQGLPGNTDPAGAIDGDAGAYRPGDQRERDVHDALGMDGGIVHLPVYGALRLPTESVVLSEDETTRLILDENGIRKRVLKQSMSMPQFIEFPVADRRAWEELRAGLDTSFAARTPANWPELVASLRRRTFPIALGGYPEGLFGELRQLMGAERLLFTFHDDPGLIHDMLRALTELWLGLWEEVLAKTEVDCVHFWEDLCFRSGPLISPTMFRRFLMPCYTRLTSFLRAHGIDIILVDTDGDCNLLIPLFLEAGVTGLYPMEVQAGMDIVAVAQRYPRLQIFGGIAKQALAQGREAIDRELARRLPYMLRRGGYIPTVDHHIPPDVSWDNFSYYRRRVAEYYADASPIAGPLGRVEE